ncbi:MAG: hypothetical protein IRZ16_03690 [Myxococcaceae bacterium]|nr:hypothetical protein [Myxococcaceae bacterium]
MNASELATDTPPPEDLAKLANEIPDPTEIVERELRERLDRIAPPSAHDDGPGRWPPILEEPRLRADSRYADPATSHRPLIGPVLVAAKRSFRFLFQPFINEVLRRQVEFNQSILSSLALMYEQVKVNAQTQAMWRKEVERRLEALEAAADPAQRQTRRLE